MKGEEGLTLIELISTLAILFLIFLLVIPSTSFLDASKSNLSLKVLAEEVVKDLRYIQQKSIFEREILYFDVAEGGRGYYLIAYNDNRIIKERKFPQGVTIEKNISKEISFKETGVPSSGGCTITLKNENKKIEITILPATGRIMMKGIY
ncbi:prepilin-type cleavage/methylation domain-containing protein [Caldanaerobacter sp.]|uniref:prepilin-type cleavage/methylation domain-containing protein n=1 Tax=Caldanaerobacter sp. TaxID=2930036 RepID=UPI003C712A00